MTLLHFSDYCVILVIVAVHNASSLGRTGGCFPALGAFTGVSSTMKASPQWGVCCVMSSSDVLESRVLILCLKRMASSGIKFTVNLRKASKRNCSVSVLHVCLLACVHTCDRLCLCHMHTYGSQRTIYCSCSLFPPWRLKGLRSDLQSGLEALLLTELSCWPGKWSPLSSFKKIMF